MPGPIRVDWQAIKNRWGSTVSEPHLFVLPKGFAQLVLAIQERLHWEATYRIDGYDFADWDELQTIVDNGLGGLTDSVNLTQLFAALQDIEDAIYETACCDATIGSDFDVQQNTDPVTEGVGDVPGNVVNSGYSTDAADWAGFEDYKCDAAHVLVDSAIVITNKLEQILDLIDLPLGALGAIAALAGVVGAIYTAGGLALVFGILGATGAVATLWSFFAEVADEALLETTATEFETYRDEIVCAIMGADGATAAAAAVRSVIGDNFTFPTIPSLYFWDSYLAALYAGRWGDTDFAQSVKDSSRFGSTCECDIDFDFLHDVDQDQLAINSGGYFQSGSGTVRSNASGTPCGTIWTLRMSGSGAWWEIHPFNAADIAGYTLPANYEAYVERVEWDECRAESSPLGEVQIIDATDNVLDSVQWSTIGTHTWDPTPDGPVKNSSTSPKALRFSTLSGALALSTIRVYWRIVEI